MDGLHFLATIFLISVGLASFITIFIDSTPGVVRVMLLLLALSILSTLTK